MEQANRSGVEYIVPKRNAGQHTGLEKFPALTHYGNRSPRAQLAMRSIGGKVVQVVLINGEPRGW